MKKFAIIGTIASSILTFRRALIEYLKSQGYEIYCFATDLTADDVRRIEEIGANAVRYQLSRGGLNPFSDIYNTYTLATELRKIQPDIVLSYFAKPAIFGTLAARFAKASHIYAMLEGLGYFFTEQPSGQSFKTRLIKQVQIFLYRIALPKASGVIFLNHDDPNDLLNKYHIYVRKYFILGAIGLNLAEYPYTPYEVGQPIRFLFIGRLLREKGIYDFLQAAQIVKKRYPNIIFDMLGATDFANPGSVSEDILNQYIIESIIQYHGQVNNVSDYIVQSSVFVLPSYREGVPRSTQEAMAIGRAIITTDVPGCRETVVNNHNGFIVKKWDPEALAEKMIYFIKHPEQIREMGEISHKMAVEKFDAEKVNQRLLHMMDLI